MSNKLDEIPDQKLFFFKGNSKTQYVSAASTDFVEPELTLEDIEYVDREEINFKIPKDRQLFSVYGSLIAMPKDIKGMMERIENGGKPITRFSKMKAFLLKLVRGKNAAK